MDEHVARQLKGARKMALGAARMVGGVMTDSYSSLRGRGAFAVALAVCCLVLVFPRVTFAQDRAKQTIAYWKMLKAIGDQESPGPQATLQQKISAVRNVAHRIDDLSARGVDQEAIDVAEKMVKLCKRAAAFLDDYGDATKGFQAGFRDGLNGNPTRAIDEANAIRRQNDALQEAASRARKRLESRYDVDLPSLN